MTAEAEHQDVKGISQVNASAKRKDWNVRIHTPFFGRHDLYDPGAHSVVVNLGNEAAVAEMDWHPSAQERRVTFAHRPVEYATTHLLKSLNSSYVGSKTGTPLDADDSVG